MIEIIVDVWAKKLVSVYSATSTLQVQSSRHSKYIISYFLSDHLRCFSRRIFRSTAPPIRVPRTLGTCWPIKAITLFGHPVTTSDLSLARACSVKSATCSELMSKYACNPLPCIGGVVNPAALKKFERVGPGHTVKARTLEPRSSSSRASDQFRTNALVAP